MTKEYYQLHKEEILKKTSAYAKTNREKINASRRGKRKEVSAKYYQKYKAEISERTKEYRSKNAEIIKERKKLYREKNKDKINQYFDNRRSNDPLFRVSANLRSLISTAITRGGYTKKSKTQSILGCSFVDFKNHIESQYSSWMNWDNYGLYDGNPQCGWDLDHIIPMITAQNEEGVIALNHYTNFQPLCSYVNRYVKKDNIL